MIADFLDRVANGVISERNLESQRRSRFRSDKQWKRRLRGALNGIAMDGATHVAEEFERQVDDDAE